MNLFARFGIGFTIRSAVAIVAGLTGGICSAGLIAVIGYSINSEGNRARLLAILFLSLCAAVLLSRVFSERLFTQITQDLVLKLRLSLSGMVLQLSLKRQEEFGKNELFVLLTQDIDSLTQAAQLLPTAINSFIIIFACLIYMGLLSPVLGALMATFIGCGIIGYRLAERRPIRQFLLARQHIETLYSHFRALLDGNKELQLNVARGNSFIKCEVDPAARLHRKSLISAMNNYIWVNNIGALLFFMVIGIVEYVLPILVPIKTDLRVSSTLVLLYLVQPVTALMSVLPSLRQASVSMRRIFRMTPLLRSVHAVVANDQDPFGFAGSRITLHDICCDVGKSDTGEPFHLGPINVSFNSGEITFIVGGNGSGKTTLALLITGLAEASSGWIELNGERLTCSNMAHYRARFSAVFYDFYIFEHLLGPDLVKLDEQASYYLQLLELDHKVQVRDGRLSTTRLSSGQRRRLALLSAYVEDRPVYIFDEWAADQDPEFRDCFYNVLLPGLKRSGKTIIVITHDERYFGKADKLVMIEGGTLRCERQHAQDS